jgi:hypothetical protein
MSLERTVLHQCIRPRVGLGNSFGIREILEWQPIHMIFQ